MSNNELGRATTDDTTNFATIPVLVEQNEKSTYAYTEELIGALMDDYSVFQGEVQRKMQIYRQALSAVSSDLYKDVFKRLVDGDTMNFNHEALFQGWHSPGYQACDNVKSGLDDMGFALRQARVYARAMQRPMESARNKAAAMREETE